MAENYGKQQYEKKVFWKKKKTDKMVLKQNRQKTKCHDGIIPP